MSKFKIKNHSDLIRDNGCIVNTNKEEYNKRINILKKNSQIEKIINDNENMKKDINQLKDNMDEILKILKGNA